MQPMYNQTFSTPRQQVQISPQQEINNHYNQLMMQYSELEQEMYSQKSDNHMKYQQIVTKIDHIYNELTTNINQLQYSSRQDYQQLLQELKSQREQNIQMLQTIALKQQAKQQQQYNGHKQNQSENFYDYIDQQEQQLLEDLQTLDSYKQQKYDNNDLMPISSRVQMNYLSPTNHQRFSSNYNSIQQQKQHTPLQSTQYSQNTPQMQYINKLRQNYGTIEQQQKNYESTPQYHQVQQQPRYQIQSQEKYYNKSPILITNEEQIVDQKNSYHAMNVSAQPEYQISIHKQAPPYQTSINYQEITPVHKHKPIFDQQITNKSRITEPNQCQHVKEISIEKQPILRCEQEQKIVQQAQTPNRRQNSQQSLPLNFNQQQPSIIHQKEKIFDQSQINLSRDKSTQKILQQQYSPQQQQQQQQQQILNISQFEYNNTNQNEQVLPPEVQNQNVLNESQQSYIMDLYGNLGYDQFYQYLCQKYPIQHQLQYINNKPNHGDQRILRQDQEALDLMQYIYCTMCDQFISIKQANNHLNFCINNKQSKQQQDDKYLDLFICCTDPMNQYIETREQKQRRLINELTKIKYLIEVALKQKEYTLEQQKQKEYCLFTIEILNLIIQNPRNQQINQQMQDLVSIYQVLDQQQYNFYKQIVFLLQKANVRIQQLIQ
ncbi:unnamed protein product [Paramecium sonneborni]|uniref:Uncharacterized protein n=1 Tax=Paramecium sonneborni TaxID=65129 RepID=A0A8S1PNR8_9CILI|nr:unnamed protein product [Paramecium sonneborni]